MPAGAPPRALRLAGLAVGAGVVVLTAPALTPAAGPAPLPLTVDASVVRSGEVGVDGREGLLTDAEIRPGEDGAVAGGLDLVSQTGVPVELTLQEVGPPTGWEDQLWLRIALDNAEIFHGPQSSLRRTTSSPVTVAPGTRVALDVTVSLPAGTPAVFEGRRVELRLRIASSPAAPAPRG